MESKINKKVRLLFFLVFILQQSLFAMPGVGDIGGMSDDLSDIGLEEPILDEPAGPLAPAAVPTVPPTVPAPVIPGAVPTLPGALSPTTLPSALPTPLPGAPGAPAPSGTVPSTYTSDVAMLASITEASSPGLPIFSEVATQKSKIAIYEALLRTLKQPKFYPLISFDIKQKMFSGFITDLIDPALISDLVTDVALFKIVSLGKEFETLLRTVRSDVSKISSPDSSRLTKQFNATYTTLLARRAAIEKKFKKQSDFLELLDKIQQILPSKFNERYNGYKQAVSQVTKSIIPSSRQRLITDLGKFLNLLTTDEQRKKVLELIKLTGTLAFLSVAEKNQLTMLEKSVPAAPVVSKAPVAPVVRAAGPVSTGRPVPTKAAVPTKAPVKKAVAPAKKVVVTVNVADYRAKVKAAGKDYNSLIKLGTIGIDLIAKAAKAKEKRELIAVVQGALVSLYNSRGSLNAEQLKNLIALLEKAKSNPNFSKSVSPKQINSLKLISQLNVAAAEKDALKRINLYQQATGSINADSDAFECGKFLDGVTNLFSMRNKMDSAQVNALKELINKFNTLLKGKHAFGRSTQKLIEEWLKVIECTSILLSPYESKPIAEQVVLFNKILNDLTISTADYERRLFVTAITRLFNSRGNATKKDLETMKTLFTQVQGKAGVLSSNQVPVMVLWIKELTNAANMTTGTKGYISVLLQDAAGKRNLGLYKSILQLITSDTPSSVLSEFVAALNAIFTDRNFYDKSQVLSFFKTVNTKKLSPITSLLGPAQKSVMDQWIKILDDEIKAAAKPA
jgi:hypothetical protein